MKVILVVTDSHGKNLVFVSAELHSYTLQEAIHLARDGAFDHIYAVNGSTGAYLRTRPSAPQREQLDRLSTCRTKPRVLIRVRTIEDSRS